MRGLWQSSAMRGGAVGLAVLVAVAVIAGAGPVVAQPGPTSTTEDCSTLQVFLSNPQPGDVIIPGDYVVQGQAIDFAAPTPPGIDRIQLFVDKSREAGGRLIGEVSSSDATPAQHLTATDFAVVASIPDTAAENNTHLLFVYARSQQTGAEQVLSVTYQLNKPLAVGALTPTPTPPPAESALKPCGTPTPTPTFPAFPSTAHSATPGAIAPLTLSVANPSPGDSLSSGTYVIQGEAFDPLAQGSTGIGRVDVFLDPREAGGEFLGQASFGNGGPGGAFGFQLVGRLPNRKGGHVLSVYAHSSVSDREALVSIPITIQ